MMEKKEIKLTQIGVIHSPYRQCGDSPRQGRMSENEMTIEIYPEFAPALKMLDQVSHFFVLYWGDRANRDVLQSRTPFSEEAVGVFASRSPNRPNPIALCIATLLHREGNLLHVKGLDALDGSPLLDIKVYSPAIDIISDADSWQLPDDLGKTANSEPGTRQ